MTSQDPMVPKTLLGRDKDTAWMGFLILAGLFIASLVTCNLISQVLRLGCWRNDLRTERGVAALSNHSS